MDTRYKTSEARRQTNKKYLLSQDEIKVRLPKGYKKQIADYVANHTNYSSVNQYISALITLDMLNNDFPLVKTDTALE